MNELHHASEGWTEALDRVLELVVLLGDDMAERLTGEGLSVPRAHLLWRLHHDGPTTQRVLADGLAVTPRNVTGLVDGLAATGFVTREPHPTDRRATLVALTARGASAIAEMDDGHRKLAELLFADMSPRDFRAFGRGLGHVLGRLREGLQAEPRGRR